MYPGMKRLTLTVVAVLLAVPALAQAKSGIEFDRNIEFQQPGSQQTFSVFIHGSGGGAPPTVSFRNTRTGKVIEARTVRTDEMNSRGSVTFPDSGPWSATLSIGGRSLGDPMIGSEFKLAAAPAKPAAAPTPPSGDDGFPLWLLTLPVAGLAALAIWLTRRRPRELGT